MKLGIVTYTSLHCNFTNYGTVLQAWAMSQSLRTIPGVEPILVDYCPNTMKDKDPLNPIQHMWDTNSEARRLCEMTLPAIKENFRKIFDFYHQRMEITHNEYDADCFDDVQEEGVERFLIGSDSIFDIGEFGLDDVFFANTKLMRGNSIAYGPSFQDSIDNYQLEDLLVLNKCLLNFKRLSLREQQLIPYVKKNVREDVKQVLDPTLLLNPDDYNTIIGEREMNDKYILYYSRRYNPQMESFVYNLSKQEGLRVVEISLRATNADKGIMRYDAGIEEFLSLVKNCEYVVTNSYHCLIFAIQFSRNFFVFSREHCDRKIVELLQMVGLEDRYCKSDVIPKVKDIDFSVVRSVINRHKETSLLYLKEAVASL